MIARSRTMPVDSMPPKKPSAKGAAKRKNTMAIRQLQPNATMSMEKKPWRIFSLSVSPAKNRRKAKTMPSEETVLIKPRITCTWAQVP